MINSTIISAASSLPQCAVKPSELMQEARIEKQYGIPNNIIETELGVLSLRQAPADTTNAQLATAAAQNLFNKIKFKGTHVDAIIYCGTDRDYVEPSTAHIIQNQLGLTSSLCMDLANACHGITSGIIVADAFISSGKMQHVLLVTSEICSQKVSNIINKISKGEWAGDIKHALGAFGLGDGGGAVLLGPSPTDKRGIIFSNNEAVGSHYKLCHYKNISTAHMNMAKIAAQTLRLSKKMMPESLSKLNWKTPDIDCLVLHQVGKKPFEKTLHSISIDNKKAIKTFANYGNLVSANISLGLEKLEESGRMRPNKKLMLMSSGSGISVTHMGIVL